MISASEATAKTVDELLRFFGITSPENWNRVWEPSLTRFRRSPSFTPETPPTTVWLRIGQRAAAEIATRPYTATGLSDSMTDLRALTRLDPELGLRQLRDECAKVGVAVVFSSEIKGCRASGATWWSRPDKAVILLSDRGKREDRVWFSFFHEVGHLLKHAKRDTYLDQTGPDSEGPPWEDQPPRSGFIDDGSRDSVLEREADDFASSILIPDSALSELRRATSASAVSQLADRLGIAPGIVAGRWQFEHKDFSKFNTLRRPLPAALFKD